MELVYETATEKPDNTDTLNTPPNSMEAPCYSPEYDPGPSPTGVPEYVPTYNPTFSPVSPDYYPTDPFNSPTKAGTSRAQIVSPTQNEDDSDEVNCTYELYTIDEQGLSEGLGSLREVSNRKQWIPRIRGHVKKFYSAGEILNASVSNES